MRESLDPSPRTRATLLKVVGALTSVALLGAVFALGARYGSDQVRARDEWVGGKLLSTAIDSVRANALDSLPSEELIRRAVSGMLRELHDPYAALLRPEGYKSYRGALLGESQGMGMSLRLQGPLLSVRRVAVGSPAATAGVHRGDRVLEWNGLPITDARLRAGADSSRVQGDHTELLLWRAPRGDSIRVTVHRATWHTPAVTESGLLSDSVGYVRLATITQRATEEVERTVTALTRRGARSLVLDLRGNGGGLFEEGVSTAGLFLPTNVVVASLAGRGGSVPQVYRARGSRWPTMPLTVLVDAGTASAAEVIAAALREHDRALLVGAPTYGKGVVQRVVRLSPELSLRLTTARWLTPTGRMLVRRQGTGPSATGGLQPDVLLDDATWRDPSGVPRDWSALAVTSIVAEADSVAMQGLRDGWVTSSVAMLESRVRQQVSAQIPRRLTSAIGPAQWVGVATRLAMARILEVRTMDEALLRYAMREDAALRAGLEVLAPGRDATQMLPSDLPRALVAR
ncbi:MAG: S41 family peptidase [Gemmatimonas sp.]